MAKVTLVLGLAGSGKSFYAEKQSAATGAKIFEGVEHHGHLPAIVERLKDGKDCIMEEIAYCDSATRETLLVHIRSQVPDVEVEFVCFENDLGSANWNLAHRTNKRDVEAHLAINDFWRPRYSYPEGAKVLPITRIRQNEPTA